MKRVALSALAVAIIAPLAQAQPPRPGGDRPAPPNPLLMIFDGDQDGVISKDELAKAGEALLKLDKNENGKIEESELPRPQRPQFGRRPGEGRPGEGRPGGDRPGGDRPSAEERFKERDKDGDGALSKDEFTAGAPEQFRERAGDFFDRLDEDGNGKITLKEMEALRDRFRRPGGGRPGGGRPGEGRPGEGRPRRPGGEDGGRRPNRPERPDA